MTAIKNKSKTNLEAADILIKNKKYSASVHCSYYACLQFSKFLLNNFNFMSYSQQNSLIGDSHKQIIDEMTNRLMSKDVIDADCYLENMTMLKKNRVKADYRATFIDADFSNTSKDLSEQVVQLLKTSF